MQERSGSSSCGWSVHKDVTLQTHSDFLQQTYDNKQGYFEINSTYMDDSHVL